MHQNRLAVVRYTVGIIVAPFCLTKRGVQELGFTRIVDRGLGRSRGEMLQFVHDERDSTLAGRVARDGIENYEQKLDGRFHRFCLDSTV